MQYMQVRQQSPQPSVEDVFAEIDSNQDGSIDKAEFTAFDTVMQATVGETPGVEQFFQNNDTNGDDLISEEEMAAGAAKMQPPQGISSKPAGGPGGPGGLGGPRGGGGGRAGETDEESSSTSTDPADTNGDGKVSFSEYIASLAANSTDNSGKVDLQALLDKLGASSDKALRAYAASNYDSSASGSTFSAVG